ncbi:MAG: hypothetical protein JRJ27_22260, partial [Deltaproteobacteria bacterium]|nr:hypothetical protein [Deltaproteobacteria bacterium]
MKHSQVLIFGFSILLIGLVSISIPGFSYPKDEVRIGLINYPSTVNIVELKTIATIPVIGAVHQFLFGIPNYKKGGLREPDLVKSFKFLPNKKDLKLTLRKGVRFHTGDP